MIKVSIICLIYKSTRWLDFIYNQIKKYTNLEENEFYFVANDASDLVLEHLKRNNIPFHIYNNTEYEKNEWYINNIYRAWNTGAKVAKGEYIVFINSDMAFSPGWLDTLYDSIKDNMVICSRLVERGILKSGTYGIEKNFGNVPEDYNENEFLEYCKQIQHNIIIPSGLYMPMLIKKIYFEKVYFFPEGNILPNTNLFDPTYAKFGELCISGDKVLIEKLKLFGIEHYTNFNSIVYHFQEGEIRDTI